MNRSQSYSAVCTRRYICFCMSIVWILVAGGAWSAILKVPQDHPTIAKALEAAKEGDEVWVTQGTYIGNSSIMKNNIGVYGGFAGTETQRDQRNPVTHPTLFSQRAELFPFRQKELFLMVF